MSGWMQRIANYFETLVGFYILALGVTALGDLLSVGGGDVVFPLVLFFGGSLLSAHGSLCVLKSPVNGLFGEHHGDESARYAKIFWVMFMALLMLALVFIIFTRMA